MSKNSFLKRLSILLLVLSMSVVGMACEISFSVAEKSKKDVYQAGSEIVVEQKVVLIHRNCHVSIGDTKTSAAGCEITGATKWVETSPGTFERKLKVKVLSGKESEMKISCVRSCDKDGGSGNIVLKKKS